MGGEFLRRYRRLSSEKDSYLCVGLDPVPPGFRDRYVVPRFLVESFGLLDGLKKFCLEVVRAVAPYTPMIKVNVQHVLPLGLDDLREVASEIRASGCLSMLDMKLSDIASTNEVALRWVEEAGFDAVTFSPFPGYRGGVDVVYRWAEETGKGIFVLCRMSNPGASDIQLLKVDGLELYKKIASEARERGVTGLVVGCTAPRELKAVREIVGDEALILSPGLGVQGGNPREAFKAGANREGENLIVVSARSIIYAYENFGWPGERFAEAASLEARRRLEELRRVRNEALTQKFKV